MDSFVSLLGLPPRLLSLKLVFSTVAGVLAEIPEKSSPTLISLRAGEKTPPDGLECWRSLAFISPLSFCAAAGVVIPMMMFLTVLLIGVLMAMPFVTRGVMPTPPEANTLERSWLLKGVKDMLGVVALPATVRAGVARRE